MKCNVCGKDCKNNASLGMHQLMAHQIARPVSPRRSELMGRVQKLEAELADSRSKLKASLADSGHVIKAGKCSDCGASLNWTPEAVEELIKTSGKQYHHSPTCPK